MSECHCVL